MKTETSNIEFTRINNDVNGNPRYVCHLFALLTQSEIYADMDIYQLYNMALKRAHKLGGKKFNNKQYGGGIVFQSYSLPELEKQINNIKNS